MPYTIEFLPGKHLTGLMYQTKDMLFSFLDKPDYNVFYQLTCWHRCRETFVGEISKYFSKSPGNSLSDRNFKKLRFCAARTYSVKTENDIESINHKMSHDEKSIRASVSFLNTLEKHLGWSLTKTVKFDNSDLKKKFISCHIITGSPKWMRAPQLMSLYLLIIRLGAYNDIMSSFKNVSDFDDVARKFEAVIKTKDFDASNKKDDMLIDANWFNKSKKHIMLMLNNANKLFFCKPIKNNYLGVSSYIGINEMVVVKHLEKGLREKWTSIIDKARKENQSNEKC